MKTEFVKYKPEINRITKKNSILVNGRLFYITKKDYTGKAVPCYVVYDYETKIQLAWFWDKDKIEDKLTRILKKERIYDKLDLFFEKVSK